MTGVEDDIAYLRALTAEGPGPLRREGAILAAAGMIFGLSAVRTWALQTGHLPHQLPWYGWGPFDAVAVFGVTLVGLMRCFPGQPFNAASRAFVTTLGALGVCATVLTAGLAAAAWRLNDGAVLQAFPVALLSLYGALWSVAFALRRRPWLAVLAATAFALAVLSGFVAGRPELWLVLAAGLWLLVAAPGVALLRTSAA